MNLTIAFKLLTFVESIVLGCLVLRQDSRSRHSQLFALYIFAIAASSFVELQLSSVQTLELFRFWKAFDVFMYIAVALAVHFVLEYTGGFGAWRGRVAAAMYLLISLIVALDSLAIVPEHIVQSTWGFESYYSPAMQNLYFSLVAVVSAVAVGGLGLLLRCALTAPERRVRMQATILFASFVVLVVTGIVIELIIPVFVTSELPLAISATTAFLFLNPFLVYAVLRFEVLRIAPAAAADDILRMLSDGVFLADPRGIVQYVNPRASEMLGLPPGDILGRRFVSVLKEPSRELVDALRALGSATRQSFVDIETILYSGAERYLPVSVSASVLESRQWGPLGTIITVRDISERKRAGEIRGSVDRILQHDLKTPLTAVMALPEALLADPDTPEKHREALEVIRRAAVRMRNQIDAYLKLERIEHGTYQLDPAPVDIVRVCRAVVDSVSPWANAKRLRLGLHLDGRLVDTEENKRVYLTEESLMSSMLGNIVKNAVEACPPESDVSIRLSTRDGLSIAVHNLGTIPEAIRPRFFTKYVTFGKKSGTGLGTYSAKLIAESLGGTIAYTTSEADGTTVTVVFPKMAPM
ncbi:MAG: PAS domain S-box protein [Chitinivibrionales bacterium]|nr:PAS domain S-box protein [Chitinivibrionales bacterium]